MKKFFLTMYLAVILFGAAVAYADLNSFMRDVNVQARTDMKNFSLKLSAQFGIPVSQVDIVVKSVSAPADAFMVLQLGHMANKHPDVVLETYKHSHKRGWGALAKELGIKPGSPEFHALKRGDLYFTGTPDNEGHGNGKGKGKGKGKGHNG